MKDVIRKLECVLQLSKAKQQELQKVEHLSYRQRGLSLLAITPEDKQAGKKHISKKYALLIAKVYQEINDELVNLGHTPIGNPFEREGNNEN